MMKKKTILFTAVFLLYAANALCADGKRCQEDVWCPTLPGPFTTFTASIIEKNKFVMQTLYFFNMTRGIFDGEGSYTALPGKDYKYQQFIQLYTQYAPIERLEFNAQPQWKINYARVDGATAENAGFADFLMNIRWCPIDESYWCPRVTPIFQVKLPTGKYQKADEGKLLTDITGTGSTDYTFGASFTKGIKPVEWHLDVLWTTSPAPVRIDGIKTEFADQCIINGAFEWVFYKKLNLMSELLWQTQGDRKEDGNRMPSTAKSSLKWAIGIGYSEQYWQVLFGYQRTLLGENEDADDTIAATIIIVF
jgi:hypothetical protein